MGRRSSRIIGRISPKRRLSTCSKNTDFDKFCTQACRDFVACLKTDRTMLPSCGAFRPPLASSQSCFLPVRATARQAATARRSPLLQDGHARRIATASACAPEPAGVPPCLTSAAHLAPAQWPPQWWWHCHRTTNTAPRESAALTGPEQRLNS